MNRVLCVLLGALLAMPVSAQWLNFHEKNIPRKADGSVNLDAPAPRLPNGKPNLAGLWLIPNIQEYGWNIGKDLEGGGPPMRAWTRKLVEQRIARHLIDDPSSRCYPTGLIGLDLISPFRVNVLDDRIIILFEQNTTFRQILLDGRALPDDPVPSYMGYSVGHWEGDTLVVESSGFNGKSWIDADGHPITEQLHLTERFRRVSFGRLEIELTFDDPLAYTKPWTVRLPFHYVPDSELTESYCEDNRFTEQLRESGLEPTEVVPQAPPPGEAEASADNDASAPSGATLDEQLQGLPTKRTDRGLILTLGDVLFDVGQSKLKPDADGALDRIAAALKQVPQRRVTIKGYTDNIGSDESNLALSSRRAQAVRAALIARNVVVWQITAVGMGKKFPVASNDDAAGRQQNRRVELVFND